MTRFNKVTVWMANDTVIGGVLRRNGEVITVPAWTREQLQDFAYRCAWEGVSVQAYIPCGLGEYVCSYVVGDPVLDGKLFRTDI